MRATTIRFTPDLWQRIEREAALEGISVAQYVRDAVLYRIAYVEGARSEGASRERQPRGGADVPRRRADG